MRKVWIWLFVFAYFLGLAVQLHAEIYYPWKKVYIGALDAKHWAGMVLVPEKENAFAFKIRINKDGQTAEGTDLLYLISEVGPHAPDGSYARIKMDLGLALGREEDTPILKKPSKKSETLILEWSRKDEKTVVGKISIPKDIQIQIIHYFPWNIKGDYTLLQDGQVRGLSPSQAYHYLFWPHIPGESVTSSGDGLILSYSSEETRELYFTAGVEENTQKIQSRLLSYKNTKTIQSILDEENKRYEKRRVQIHGLYEGVSRAVTNNLFWMTLYQPGKDRFYIPAGRKWIFPRTNGVQDLWTIFEWDSFFNALQVSIESSQHSKDVLESVIQTQYPNGNIPNWRGEFGGTPDRSQPPVGAYVVYKIFQKLGDLDILESCYPALKQWHSFWMAKGSNGIPRRDGNQDGLLEWGSDTELVSKNPPPWEKNVMGRKRAMWESGQDDLPNWDETSFIEQTGTLNMNCLDLNCLYALDAYCLAQIAHVLKLNQEYKSYMKEYRELKQLINQRLWNETEGFYYDRYWNGIFSKNKAASNFYPLLAGIPDEDQARQMLAHLLNEQEFWGEYILPTISRDHPAFDDQQYWRGTIWSPTNYLIYQGLKAYGFDAVASEFAWKSSSLFMRTWENYQICPENFDSRSGEPGGQRYQSWGPLLALMSLEEYIDFTPWEGFRFGMLDTEVKGNLSRISIQGRHYDLLVSPSKLNLDEEGKRVLSVNGPVIVRHFLYSKNLISFEIKSLQKRKVEVKFLTKGKYQLSIDDQAEEIFKGKSKKFKVSEGEHSVLILLLKNLD
ncbi:MAG: Bacterial alpha-L-rhamnosidase [Candidatus Aminicenantes bacterium]|nr:Bacterial alpha-L-rhamnosidase [Candidatus Aminicenantes bacterium]